MENVNGWIHNHNKFIYFQYGQLNQLVVEQQSEKIEHRMTRDDILSSVLGERSGYVRGKGYGNKPPKKTQIQQADIEASVSLQRWKLCVKSCKLIWIESYRKNESK
ncbi:hypothetical protein KY285_010591 [Solanum tuberosum]|nr:hypothetical protein KY289_011137 [Solanum tuberosum]KAH0734884.1 hypothetical protein KY285_010591 [Solanum tuberosum]